MATYPHKNKKAKMDLSTGVPLSTTSGGRDDPSHPTFSTSSGARSKSVTRDVSTSGGRRRAVRSDGRKLVEKGSLNETELVEAKSRARLSKKTGEMTENAKREERRAANRLSAFQSRHRRKVIIEDLQKTVAQLSKDNVDQRKQIEELTKENDALKKKLLNAPAIQPTTVSVAGSQGLGHADRVLSGGWNSHGPGVNLLAAHDGLSRASWPVAAAENFAFLSERPSMERGQQQLLFSAANLAAVSQQLGALKDQASPMQRSASLYPVNPQLTLIQGLLRARGTTMQ